MGRGDPMWAINRLWDTVDWIWDLVQQVHGGMAMAQTGP